ncbi:hypothetical protein [Nibricoccus aquaticus]|nr:hypothetical protein [Nibricoccus aquaticus]
MKFNAGLAKSLLMAASIGMVVPLVAQTAPKKTAPKGGAAKPAPAPEAAAEEEAEIVLPGSVIARSGGGFLSLTVEGIHFKLSFYDAKKKPVDADAIRAIARWDPVNKAGEERSILNPADEGKALRGNVAVRPPYVFKVYLTLIGPDDVVLESHVVNFRG